MAKVFTGNVAINQTIAMSIRTTFHSENKRNNNNKHTDKRVLFSSYHRRRVHYSAAFFTLQPKWIVSALPGGRLHLLRTVHRQGTNPHLPNASPPASTASPCYWPTSPIFARSSPSPLTQNAQNLSIGAPGTVSQRQLDELNIRFKLEV